MPATTEELSRLGDLLQEAARIAVDERTRMKVDHKPDDSLVTNADRAVEKYLREELPKLAPNSTVWGEEQGHEDPGTGGLWLVDPIDGTSNYSFGQPLWGVSIALYRDGVLDLGGVALPDLNETYVAARGKGATLNGKPLPLLEPGPIRPTELINIDTDILRQRGEDRLPGKARISGAFVIGGTFVASGRFRGLIAHGERLYDVAACVIICRELGADIRFANGTPLNESDFIDRQPMVPAWIIFPPDSGFTM